MTPTTLSEALRHAGQGPSEDLTELSDRISARLQKAQTRERPPLLARRWVRATGALAGLCLLPSLLGTALMLRTAAVWGTQKQITAKIQVKESIGEVIYQQGPLVRGESKSSWWLQRDGLSYRFGKSTNGVVYASASTKPVDYLGILLGLRLRDQVGRLCVPLRWDRQAGRLVVCVGGYSLTRWALFSARTGPLRKKVWIDLATGRPVRVEFPEDRQTLRFWLSYAPFSSEKFAPPRLAYQRFPANHWVVSTLIGGTTWAKTQETWLNRSSRKQVTWRYATTQGPLSVAEELTETASGASYSRRLGTAPTVPVATAPPSLDNPTIPPQDTLTRLPTQEIRGVPCEVLGNTNTSTGEERRYFLSTRTQNRLVRKETWRVMRGVLRCVSATDFYQDAPQEHSFYWTPLNIQAQLRRH